ncbi:MAG: orotate phosphoribosyltransferase [Flavobacteriaceae bacterium]
MIYDPQTATKTAEYLLQINAIKLSPKNPFTWASGWQSPIYCDNRITLSYPSIRTYLADSIASQITNLYGTDIVIAGVATGAIGMGMLVAHKMQRPFVYVRPESKKHGRKNQIEGHLEPGAKVVVVEDLISTGTSSLNAVSALRAQQNEVLGMIALFTYGFSAAEVNFSKAHLTLHTLSDYPTLIETAIQKKAIETNDQIILRQWRDNPAEWTVRN